MDRKNLISPSLEDYLEIIYKIIKEKQVARSKDISEYLKVRSASVTNALQILKSKNLINYAPYEVVTLTKEGELQAEDITKRHENIKKYLLTTLGIDSVKAENTACKFEHELDPDVFKRILHFNRFCKENREIVGKFFDSFFDFCRNQKIE